MNRLVARFAANPVAANLLFLGIVAAGLLQAPFVEQELVPELSARTLRIALADPGASPAEVEQLLCIPTEEALADVDGVARVSSEAREGSCSVYAELRDSPSAARALDEVKARVEAVDGYPDSAERPRVEELRTRSRVISVAVHGEPDAARLAAAAERLRDGLRALDGVSVVEIANPRSREIAIEVPERELRRFGLRLSDVVEAIRRSSLDLPAGSLRNAEAELRVRTGGRARRAHEFGEIVLLTHHDGTRLRLADVARIAEGFAAAEPVARFDGAPAVLIHVYRAPGEQVGDVAAAVRRGLAESASGDRFGISLTPFGDRSLELRDRLELLLRNGRDGLLLVLIALALFLPLRHAFWASAGMVAAFLGAIAVMRPLGISFNLMSLFALIVALGLVVDDAIVVSESVDHQRARGRGARRAAIDGAREVATPVTVAVLTTTVAWVPALFAPGITGKLGQPLGAVVIACLAFSWVEAFCVLPAHLARPRSDRRRPAALARLRETIGTGLDRFLARRYRPLLAAALRQRVVVAAAGLAVLLLAGGAMRGGWVPSAFAPPVEADRVVATVTLSRGSALARTDAAVRRLEEAAAALREELEASGHAGSLRHAVAWVGDQPSRRRSNVFSPAEWFGFRDPERGEVELELAPAERREISSQAIAERWRELAGPLPDALEVVYRATDMPMGADFAVRLSGDDGASLAAAARALRARLASFPGVRDVRDSTAGGKPEARLAIRPEAEAAGLTLTELARQVRRAIHGEEVQRVYRGRNEVSVVVRYPEEERRTLGDLEGMRVRGPGGDELPLRAAARLAFATLPASIRRSDYRPVIDVEADVAEGAVRSGELLAALRGSWLPELARTHPGVRFEPGAQQREQSAITRYQLRACGLSLVAIYLLLALPLRSYTQPLVIMSAIPFGLLGAVAGHLLLGMELTALSAVGLLALAGVVINDALVLVVAANREREAGTPSDEALLRAATRRFRPILLTSLTTCAGLAPLLLERAPAAQLIRPAAVSLAFGVLFATAVTLVLVPALVRLLEDLRVRLAAPSPRPIP